MKIGKRILALTAAAVLCIGGAPAAFAQPVYSELAVIADTIYSVTAKPDVVYTGDTVSVTVVTKRNTKQVRIADESGKNVASAVSGAVDKSGRLYWTLILPAGSPGSYTYTAFAAGEYAETAYKQVAITVSPTVVRPEITQITVENMALSCIVKGYPTTSDLRFEICDAAGVVVFSDYKLEKLSAGSYMVRAYVRSDPNATCSEAVSFTVSQTESDEYAYLQVAKAMIVGNEGVYTTVVPNDNGALSVGILGWHATRAHDLLNSMRAVEPDTVESCLNETSLLEELKQVKTVWSTRILNSAETGAVRGLLGTPISHTVQDATAETDIGSYLVSGRNRGVTSPGALLYYADLYNQSPRRAVEIVNAIVSDKKELTLDNMHTYALDNAVMGRYITRRNRTYNFIRRAGYTV